MKKMFKLLTVLLILLSVISCQSVLFDREAYEALTYEEQQLQALPIAITIAVAIIGMTAYGMVEGVAPMKPEKEAGVVE